MRIRQVIALCILLTFLMANAAAFAAPAELTALEKTSILERTYLGLERTDPFVERVTKLEKETLGTESSEALLDRVDKLYTYTKTTVAATPSFLLKLNSAEWLFNHSVTMLPIKTRLEALEKNLYGNTSSGSFDARLTRVMHTAFPGGKLDAAEVTLPKDTLIKIRTLSKLDSSKSKAGDVVSFKVVDDVVVNGYLVIPRGMQGRGRVTNVEPKGNFGRDAKLEVAFDTLESLDNSMVKTLLGDKAKEQTRSLALAAGASVAGLVILGPIGIVGGVFVNGEEIMIPTGTEMYIQTATPTQLFGVQMR